MENNKNEDRHTSSLGNQSQGSDKAHEQTGTSGTESGARRSGSMDTDPSHNEMSSGDMGRGSTSSTGSSRMNDDENDSDRTTTTTRSGDDGLESSKGI